MKLWLFAAIVINAYKPIIMTIKTSCVNIGTTILGRIVVGVGKGLVRPLALPTPYQHRPLIVL
ncbi:hypothetical protein AY601_1882 [Pedobacter cryoconitis]|uniref:Uncharacterized protein n=1 Tax=Pedobacter cryoconitis TaxID=188932 RepID=A0A127VC79_9SPHI|nr:hypothetical protein AY601_1882 [Pedobacter cryoconitis]